MGKGSRFFLMVCCRWCRLPLLPRLTVDVIMRLTLAFSCLILLLFIVALRYRFFADPVTSQREALRSLQLKNTLYPTLRYVHCERKYWQKMHMRIVFLVGVLFSVL